MCNASRCSCEEPQTVHVCTPHLAHILTYICVQWIQLRLWENHRLRTLRRTLHQLSETAEVDERDGTLTLKEGVASTQVLAVYFRWVIQNFSIFGTRFWSQMCSGFAYSKLSKEGRLNISVC
jgi:hypothetical protein